MNCPDYRKMMRKHSSITEISVEKLKVSPYNVRKKIGDISDLKNSIASLGLLQPIIVRPMDHGFEVVVGQRRFIACKELGWEKIPAIVRDLSNHDALILSLTENVQTDTLDPIDRAEATHRLLEIFSREIPKSEALRKVAKIVGKSETTIREWLNLLETTEAVKYMVRERKISPQIAAKLSILPKKQQKEIAQVISEEYLPRQQALKVIEIAKTRPHLRARAVIEELEEMEEYTISISLPAKIFNLLLRRAKEEKLSVQELIRKAVKKYLGIP
jgi:ParB family chromosome partitioning protein